MKEFKARINPRMVTYNQLKVFHENTGAIIEINKGVPYWIVAKVKIEKPSIKAWSYLGVDEL